MSCVTLETIPWVENFSSRAEYVSVDFFLVYLFPIDWKRANKISPVKVCRSFLIRKAKEGNSLFRFSLSIMNIAVKVIADKETIQY